MRLSDEQIREIVSTLQMSDEERENIIRRAVAGEPEARFVVFHALCRQREG